MRKEVVKWSAAQGRRLRAYERRIVKVMKSRGHAFQPLAVRRIQRSRLYEMEGFANALDAAARNDILLKVVAGDYRLILEQVTKVLQKFDSARHAHEVREIISKDLEL